MSISSIFKKKFKETEYSDIEALVINKIRESHNIDYKENYPNKSTKLAKVLISFANASGGFIIIGIRELKANGKNTGIPDEIIGVDKIDHETKITNILASNSQPTIIPKIKVFEIPNTHKDLILTKIKESIDPIMNSRTNRFPIRINDQSLPADYSIVNKLFHKETYQVKKRINKIFQIIEDFFNKLKVVSVGRRGKYHTYQICLKDLDSNNEETHTKTQREIVEFTSILIVFKEDLKYFGSKESTPTSFYFGRYIIKQNNFIECLDPFQPNSTQNLFSNIISDLKEFSKKYFSIIL